ncbi:MAG: hypothetical protein AB1426_09810 [Bacillota bacterium]
MGKSPGTRKLSSFTIAAAYIGTVVGAGFASGQEVLQFFSFFGLNSILGLALAGTLFVFFGGIVLHLGHRLDARSYLEIVQYAGGPYLGRVVDGIVTFFLFGGLTAMAAGAGAIFLEQFGLPKVLGSSIMIAATLITVLLGFYGVVLSISFVVPALLLSVLGLSLVTLVNIPLDLEAISAWAKKADPAIPSWPLSALAYVSYNLVLSIAILAPLGAKAVSRTALKKGALLGGLGLGLGALAINMAILTLPSEAAAFEVPMVYIAGRFSPTVQAGYGVVLLAEIYTTAVANLYGFTARLADPESRRSKQLAGLVAVAAFIASLLGFANLVRYLYAAVGVAGFLLLGGLAYGFIKERRKT